MLHDKIAVIDFGGQYAHLIANKVRRLHVLAEIRQPEDPPSAYRDYRGIIISGSPSLASQGEDSAYDKGFFALDVPILGFCFGHQEIAKYYGGVIEHTQREYGLASLRVTHPSTIFEGTPADQVVWMSHGDTVTELPDGFVEIGASVDGDGVVHHNAAIADHVRKRFGFQFHAEVDDTQHGTEMLGNFVLRVCGCQPTWTMDRYLVEAGRGDSPAGGRPRRVPACIGGRGFHRVRAAHRPGDWGRQAAPAARGQRPDAKGREPDGRVRAPTSRPRKEPPLHRRIRQVPSGP